jgi:hypothetical protein
MRYINIKLLERINRDGGLNELKAFNDKIATLATEAERKDFIDKNGEAWSKLRFDLWILGHLKCWYSEAEIDVHSCEVEHFRPKKRVSKSKPVHHGYWWRAFDWKNYRIAHSIANKRKHDLNTSKLVGKGSYFPLRDEKKRAKRIDEEKNEEPILLDPTIRKDCTLIFFNLSSGVVEPSITVEADPWNHQRADETIGYYHLNEGTWVNRRFEAIKQVQILCDRIKRIDPTQDLITYEETIDELITRTSYFAEFTSLVKQTIVDKIGDKDNALIKALF